MEQYDEGVADEENEQVGTRLPLLRHGWQEVRAGSGGNFAQIRRVAVVSRNIEAGEEELLDRCIVGADTANVATLSIHTMEI